SLHRPARGRATRPHAAPRRPGRPRGPDAAAPSVAVIHSVGMTHTGWIEWLRRRSLAMAFGLLLFANLLPLTAEYLPFSDLPGHMGIVGGLARWNDPASRIRELYAINPGALYHSMLFEYLGALACRFIPVTVYTNLFLAVFYFAGLPLALLLLLRSFGRDV